MPAQPFLESVPDWRARLVCSRCGGRNVDMVVTGQRRSPLT